MLKFMKSQWKDYDLPTRQTLFTWKSCINPPIPVGEPRCKDHPRHVSVGIETADNFIVIRQYLKVR